MATPFDQIDTELGLTHEAVPMPLAQQQPVKTAGMAGAAPPVTLLPPPAAPPVKFPVPATTVHPLPPPARLPKARPAQPQDIPSVAQTYFDQIDQDLTPQPQVPAAPVAPVAPVQQGQQVGNVFDQIDQELGTKPGQMTDQQGAAPTQATPSGQGGIGFFTDLSHAAQRGFHRLEQARAGFQSAVPVPFRPRLDPAAAAAQVHTAQQEINQLQPSNEIIQQAREFSKQPDIRSSFIYLATHPHFSLDLGLESAAPSALSAAGAVIGELAGPIGGRIGLGIGSGLGEYGSSVMDTFAKKGIDFNNEEQLRSAFASKELMAEAKSTALKRGVTVGAFDSLTGALSTKIATLPAVTRFGRVGGIATGIGVEGAGGAAGEYAAEKVSGQQTSPQDIAGEFVGEVVMSGPIEMTTLIGGDALRRGTSFFSGVGTPATEDELKGAGLGVDNPPPPPLSTYDDAVQEGRTLFGFDTGEDHVKVGDYDSAEAAASKAGVRNGQLIAVKPEETNSKILDADKVAKLSKEQIDSIELAGPPDLVAIAKTQLQNIRMVSKHTDAYIREKNIEMAVSRLAEMGSKGVTITDPKGLDFYQHAIDGPRPAGRGVEFRQIDYANLTLPVNLLPNITLGVNYGGATTDIDLKKLQPGALIPTNHSLQLFIAGHGKEALLKMAEEAGSTPEGLQVLRDYYFGSGHSIAKMDAENNGSIKYPHDPRLMTGGARVADRPGAVDAVKMAIVPKPKGRIAPSEALNDSITRRSARNVRPDFSPGKPLLADGATVLKNLDKRNLGELTAGLAVIDKLMGIWKLPMDLRVLINSPLSGLNSWVPSGHSGSFGLFAAFGQNGQVASTIILQLDLIDAHRKEGYTLYGTLAHEFGHFISAAGLMRQSAESRTAIHAAYRRFLLDTNNPSSTLVSRAGVPGRGEEFDPDYQYSFEEWFADQIARWMLTNRRPLGYVAKVVRPIAKMLLQAMKAFSKMDPTNQMRPEPEIEKWMANTIGGQIKSEWAGAVQDWHDTQTKVANENASQQDLGPMSPMTIASVGVRNILQNLGVDKIEAMAVQMGVTLPPSLPALGAQVDRFNWFYKWGLSLPQVADRNPLLRPLQNYRELIKMAQLESGQIMSAAKTQLDAWRKLGRPQAQALGQFLFDMTQMNYRSAQEVAQGVRRQPTTQEVIRIAQQYGLSGRALQVYTGIRGEFQTALGKYTQLLTDAAMAITDPVEQAKRLKEIQLMQTELNKNPYFPMTRYGQWALTVRNGKALQHFELFDSQRQLKVAYGRARRRWAQGSGFNVQMSQLAEEAAPFVGVPPQMLDLIEKRLNLSGAQRKALETLKFELAPEQSFKKRFLHRNEVPGWSDDAQRNFAHYFLHHSKHYTRVKYGGALTEQIKATHAEKAFRGDDARKVTQIGNFLKTHLDEFLNPKADMSAVRSALAVWFLGFNPKSALLNMTQLGLATYPFLASKFGVLGDAKTIMHLTRAATMVRSTYQTKAGIHSAAQGANATPFVKALSEAINQGAIDESQAAELAALAQGNTILGGLPGNKGWTTFSNMAMLMFKTAEQFNRKVTFTAAWQLATNNPNTKWVQDLPMKYGILQQTLLNRGWSQSEVLPLLAGLEAIERTQFDYSREARPRYIQGRKGTLLMFHMFTQNMLYMLGSNKGTLPRFMLVMMGLGGIMGLPGMDDLDEIVRAIAARFGKDFDLELEMRKALVHIFSPEGADLALRGVSRDSFGIPQLLDMAGVTQFPHLDMSRSIGMGRVLPMNPVGLIGQPGATFEEDVSNTLQRNAGAAFGVGFNMAEFLHDSATPWGDWKRWERVMPTSVRNGSKMFRYLYQGQEHTGGVPPAAITTFDPHDPSEMAEVIATGLGFTPTRLSRKWDETSAAINQQAFWATQRQMLMSTYARAYFERDFERRKEVMNKIRDFNKEVPDKTYVIKSESLHRSTTQRQKSNQRLESGMSPTKMGTVLTRQMKEVFPDAAEVKRPADLLAPTAEPSPSQ